MFLLLPWPVLPARYAMSHLFGVVLSVVSSLIVSKKASGESRQNSGGLVRGKGIAILA
ncbi:hypothetical protein [Mucilaginibacter sp. 44-25]|uniref:hypothetical protein n=1 Tax=Mucilaginibacter sp. 44-25 TaxID=1895794 RepID=UPI000A8FB41D|nr:hypothetical protein [Mucilaginibacter sp. 44-25]